MTLFLDRSAVPLALCATLATLLGGCPSEIDRRAAQGLEALRACDVRAANAAFDDALAMDDRRSDIALAFALTELALLPEDPALQDLAPRLGFTAPLDTTFVWGRDGLLERLARRTEDCDSIGEFVESHVPHPSLRDGGPSLVDTWDPTLTLGDVRDVLVRLAPRLARIESALVVAADGMASEGVVLEGGCGIATSPTRVRAPELLALAGGFTILRAALQASRGYDGTIHASLLFSRGGNEEAWVAEVTPRYLRPIDGPALAAARPLLLEGIETWIRAIDAAQAISEPNAEAIFDWSAMPSHVLADLEVMAGAVRTSLGAEGLRPSSRWCGAKASSRSPRTGPRSKSASRHACRSIRSKTARRSTGRSPNDGKERASKSATSSTPRTGGALHTIANEPFRGARATALACSGRPRILRLPYGRVAQLGER
jgi:hypothetical protein